MRIFPENPNIHRNYIIAPYAEVGLNLGKLILDELFDSDAKYMDSTLSIGLITNFSKRYGASIYYKTYKFKYTNNNPQIVDEENFDVVGVSLFYNIQ